MDLREAIQKYLELRGDHFGRTLSAEPGKRYVRIVGSDSVSRSAVAFIDQNGDIYKPAGWKGPAKGVRGNVFRIAEGAEPVARSLYMKNLPSLPPGTSRG
jgi:hypothetical protein